ncbi:hypothetical protein LZ30DRAFT_707037 [Colletotrichum cereale]|nr:hypothetical protein LZ30DRAFT_707037 [Colletotrichum cereale]
MAVIAWITEVFPRSVSSASTTRIIGCFDANNYVESTKRPENFRVIKMAHARKKSKHCTLRHK